MSKSNIQWTGATWNPWHGCEKISPGCKYCYMFRDKAKYGQSGSNIQRSKTKFKEPLLMAPDLIFTCSWSDFFLDAADGWRKSAWDIIRKTPWHTYQILTKRPSRIMSNLPSDWGTGWDHVWIGVSVESEAQLHRLKDLSKVPAAVRFISFEPLLGPIDFASYVAANSLEGSFHWTIIGGESGNDNGLFKYRECELHWIAELVAQSASLSVPTFVKQLGTHLGKQIPGAGRHGANLGQWPEYLQRRDWPENFNPEKYFHK